MRSLILLLCVTGCDDFTPSAEGMLSLDPSASADGFTTIEVHWDAIGDVQHDVEIITPFELPRNYYVGGGCCGSDAKSFRLSAWLSNGTEASPTTGPSPGAPFISETVSVETHPIVDLVLAPYVP
jgi:hypothetical protein